ncbi:MAG: LamG-like jellyroll fold domain-containing protein [Thermogutta sp.]
MWKLPPQDFETLLQKAKAFAKTLPPNQLGSRLLLLDNWNEWGEGHYLAPHREFGFGYLDAVRRVFSTDGQPHLDLLPEDIGLGPYDVPIRTYFERDRCLRHKVRKQIETPTEEEGLMAWWTFDEADDEEVAFDYSGHRLGGMLHKTKRTTGWRGKALECRGGCVIVPAENQLSEWSQLSIECWVRTDQPNQHDKWIINRIFGGSETTGFRLGVVYGKPSFQLPLTSWSHHLVANTQLPTGRWVHLAGTFDGTNMRLYMDGKEVGKMERPGGLRQNVRPIILGIFDMNHPAYFTGDLDEVRLYNRALSPEEIAAHAASPADKSP